MRWLWDMTIFSRCRAVWPSADGQGQLLTGPLLPETGHLFSLEYLDLGQQLTGRPSGPGIDPIQHELGVRLTAGATVGMRGYVRVVFSRQGSTWKRVGR